MSREVNVKFRDYDVYKLLICGPGASGKTSLCRKITKNIFSYDYKPTVGVEFHSYEIKAENGRSVVLFYDLAGQERFRILRKLLFPGTTVVGVVFDLSNRASFREVATWIRDIRTINTDVEIVLIGNKVDKKREIDKKDAEKIAKRLGCRYLETSAVTGEGVIDMMKTLLKSAISYYRSSKQFISYANTQYKTTIISS